MRHVDGRAHVRWRRRRRLRVRGDCWNDWRRGEREVVGEDGGDRAGVPCKERRDRRLAQRRRRQFVLIVDHPCEEPIGHQRVEGGGWGGLGRVELHRED